jgi:hypothetical protein
MGIVVSLFLIAVGAILTWAVTDTSNAVNLDAVGVILMVVGLVGLLLDLLLWSNWGPGYLRNRVATTGPHYDRRMVVDEPARPARRPARRTVVEEEEVARNDAPPGPPPP